jgi:hypothetical protein
MGKPLFTDEAGNLRLGNSVRNVRARVIGDFDSDDLDGVALDFEATKAPTSERCVLKLGDFILGQDTAKSGTKNFGILDANGSLLVSFAQGVPTSIGLPGAQYTDVSDATPATLLGSEIAGAADVTVNMTANLGGAGTLNVPTAVNIVAAITGATAGMKYRLRIINSSASANAWTVTTAAGVTLQGTMTIAQNTWRDFYVTLTSLTAVEIRSIGTGTFS